MKKLYSFLIILLFGKFIVAQNVSINTTGDAADASAMLDITSTTKGMLIPRMTETQKNDIVSPATGLLVYQTDGSSGFYFYNGSAWLPLISNVSTGWLTTGNSLTVDGTHFVGTSDNIPLSLRVNNEKSGRIESNSTNGDVFYGYQAANSNTSGSGLKNTAIGYQALYTNATGDENTAVGYQALNLATGSNNIALGNLAGDNITTGSSNIIIGNNVDAPNATASNQMSIGNIIYGSNVDGTGTTVSTGSVGIGTSSPESKLEIQATEGNDAGITLDADDGDDNTDTWFIKSQASDNDLTITNHVSELMRIQDNGYVGIGTAVPGSALDVKGTMRLSGATSGYVGFAPAAIAGSTTYTLPSADGTSGQALSTDGAGNLSWGTFPSSAFGGAQNPSGRLELYDEFVGAWQVNLRVDAGGHKLYNPFSLGWTRRPSSTDSNKDLFGATGTSTSSHPGVTNIRAVYSSTNALHSSIFLTDIVDARQDNMTIEFVVKQNNTSGASGSTTEYNEWIGLVKGSSITGSTSNASFAPPATIPEGVYFRHYANGGWVGATKKSATAEQTTASSSAQTSAAWKKFKIVYNSTTTSYSFYVDGVLLGTLDDSTSKLPSAGTMLTPAFILETGNSFTGDVSMSIDYFYLVITGMSR